MGSSRQQRTQLRVQVITKNDFLSKMLSHESYFDQQVILCEEPQKMLHIKKLERGGNVYMIRHVLNMY